MISGDRRSLARLITLLERGDETIFQVLEDIHPHTGQAYSIGVTGPPGAGKSTILDGLIYLIRQENQKVGVLAVDPTSPLTGGAVLGDRIRMQRHYLDEDVFIRSLATRGNSGGLSRITLGAVKLLDAYGVDTVIVETVGVGQTEVEVMGVVDTVVVVLVPESGDAIQAMKAGLLEVADIFVINKADRPGAQRLASEVRTMLNMAESRPWWRPPILLTQAYTGEGLDELLESIRTHRRSLEDSSRLLQKRVHRRRSEFDPQAAALKVLRDGSLLRSLLDLLDKRPNA
jgi:LAO/AO transport system kinase